MPQWPFLFAKKQEIWCPNPTKKKLKRVGILFLTQSILHQVTIRISLHMFLIFHGYLWKYKDIWPIFGNKPNPKEGEQKIISPTTLLNSVIMDGLIPCSMLRLIICQRIRQKSCSVQLYLRSWPPCPLPPPHSTPISCVLEHKDLTNLLVI